MGGHTQNDICILYNCLLLVFAIRFYPWNKRKERGENVFRSLTLRTILARRKTTAWTGAKLEAKQHSAAAPWPDCRKSSAAEAHFSNTLHISDSIFHDRKKNFFPLCSALEILKQWILARNPNVECSPMLAVHWLMTILIMKYFPQQIFMDVSFPTAIWNPSCAPHQVSRILDICVVSSIPDRGGDTGDWYELCDNIVVVLRYVIRWILDPGMKCYVVVVVVVSQGRN